MLLRNKNIKIKLLFYTPVNLKYGSGFEEWLKKTCKLLKNEFDIAISYSSIGEKEVRLLKKDVLKNYKSVKNLFYLPSYNILGVVYVPKPLSVKKLNLIVKNHDVIYYNSGFFIHDFLIFLLSKFHGKKIIFGFHAPIIFDNKLHNLYIKYFASFIWRFIDKAHLNNSTDFKFLKRIINNKAYLLHNYMLKKEIPINIRSDYEGDIVFAGRFEKQKGIDLLSNALMKVLTKMKKLKFTFFGQGPMINLLQDVQKRFPKNITILKYEKNKDKIFNKRKYVLLPSRQETFSMIPLESMSKGIPIITTNIYGQKDIIKNNVNGFLSKEISVDSIAETILEATKVKEKEYLQICKNALESVKNKFTDDLFKKQFIKMILNS